MGFAINIGLALLGGPLLAGVVRKMVKARVHSRQGPPIIQPFRPSFSPSMTCSSCWAKKTWSPRRAWCCAMPLW